MFYSCDSMDWSLPGTSIHGILHGQSNKNTGLGCYFIFQGLFLPGNKTCLLEAGFFTTNANWEAYMDTSGGLVTKSLHSQCRGPGFSLWSGI